MPVRCWSNGWSVFQNCPIGWEVTLIVNLNKTCSKKYETPRLFESENERVKEINLYSEGLRSPGLLEVGVEAGVDGGVEGGVDGGVCGGGGEEGGGVEVGGGRGGQVFLKDAHITSLHLPKHYTFIDFIVRRPITKIFDVDIFFKLTFLIIRNIFQY